jgi:hypothetical protein
MVEEALTNDNEILMILSGSDRGLLYSTASEVLSVDF